MILAKYALSRPHWYISLSAVGAVTCLAKIPLIAPLGIFLIFFANGAVYGTCGVPCVDSSAFGPISALINVTSTIAFGASSFAVTATGMVGASSLVADAWVGMCGNSDHFATGVAPTVAVPYSVAPTTADVPISAGPA